MNQLWFIDGKTINHEGIHKRYPPICKYSDWEMIKEVMIMGCFDCYSDCTGGCMTACTSTCSGTCSSSCGAACSSSCSSACTGGCRTTCSGSCTDGCQTTCLTSCSSTCSGGCTGTCSSSCGAACSSSCSSGCTGGCKSTCSGSCTDSCTGNCLNTCSGSCTSGCTGTCSSSCGAACSSSCSSSCTGDCSGTCSGGCTDSCQGSCVSACGSSCSTTCSNDCTGSCTAVCNGSCTGDCSGTCSGTCTDTCEGNCATTCAVACSTTCSNDCTGTCTGTCTGGCTGTCTATCADDCTGTCSAACANSCNGSCTGGCSGTCTENCADDCTGGCMILCSTTCSGTCSDVCADDCTGSCMIQCTTTCSGTCSEVCADDCTGGCSATSTGVVVNTLGSPTINNVPSSIMQGESFTFSGSWPNAHHTATAIDGVDWVETNGASFSRTITLSTIGQHTISVSARNTANENDFGSESDTRDYTVNVVTVQLPALLGNLSMTEAVPTEVFIDESFTISGTWSNAHHTAISIDGGAWEESLGESFSRTITIDTLGQHTVSISARNTAGAEDPGTHNDTSNFIVNVVEVPVIVEALGELTMTQEVPNQVIQRNNFLISGSWQNAHHILVSTDGENWTTYIGDSFSETLSFDLNGINSVKIAARSTANESDPGFEYKEEIYDVIVLNNKITIAEVTLASVKLSIDDYVDKTVKLLLASTGNLVTEKGAASEVEFTHLDSDEAYRVILFNSFENEEAREEFVTGISDIYVSTISKDELVIVQN